MSQSIGDIYVELGAKLDKLEKGLKEAEAKTGKFSKNTEDTVTKSFGKIQSVIAGAFTVGALTAFGNQVITARGEFERFEAVLENSLGSTASAADAMGMLNDFASKTPFALNELTDSYVRLVNQGFKPSTEEMTKLGDLASSTGKSFRQLAEAILDAQVNEFERLKEFGIKASKEGDNVTFTFKGVATQVKATSEEIKNYLVGLGDIQGVSGAMAKISGTLEGRISNLGDAFNNFLIALGDTDKIKNAVSALTSLIELITPSKDKVEQFNVAWDLLQHGGEKLNKTTLLLQESLGRQLTMTERGKILMYGFTDAQIAAASAQEKLAKTINANVPTMEEYSKTLEKVGFGIFNQVAEPVAKVTDEFLKAAEALKKYEEGMIDAKNANIEFANSLADDLVGKFKPSSDKQIEEIGYDGFDASGDEAMSIINEQLFEQIPTLEMLNEKWNEYGQMISLASTFGQGLADSFTNAIFEGENMGEALEGVFTDLIKQLVAMVAQALVLAAIMAVISGGSSLAGSFGENFISNLTGGGGGGFNLGGIIKGNDIWLSGQRSGYKNQRGG